MAANNLPGWGPSSGDAGKGVRSGDGLPHSGLRSELLKDAKRRGLLHTGECREYDSPELGVMSLDHAVRPDQEKDK